MIDNTTKEDLPGPLFYFFAGVIWGWAAIVVVVLYWRLFT